MKFNPPPTVYILVHRIYKQKHFEVDSTVDLLKQLGKNNKKNPQVRFYLRNKEVKNKNGIKAALTVSKTYHPK